VSTYRFHPEAEAEFLASVEWYAARDPDVGDEFNDLVEAEVRSIAARPAVWPLWTESSELRVRVLDRFPYSIVYALEREGVVVIAVAHQKRRPGYWSARVSSP
jgi:toxin ParE1/3/4